MILINTVKTLPQQMRNNNADRNCQTPIKKWQHMSPFQDDLAIIESESSQNHQGELFNQLVGHTPSFHDEPHSQSPPDYADSLFQSLSSSSSSQQELQSDHSHTVNEMKPDYQNTTEKATMRIIDTNRKGCNCRNSKCEKNYCDCLRMGLICAEGVCSCEDCHNLEEKEIHKENKKMNEVQSRPARKCTCRKSKCLKKYCQCHSSGRKCSSLCQCIECSNQDQNERPTFDTLKKLRKTTNLLESGSKIYF